MKHAQEILAKSRKLQGRRSRNKQLVHLITCTYCLGSGWDPKYDNAGRCPVCSRSSDLTCLDCKGAGVVSVRKEADACPRVQGTGEEGIFYCSLCKGQGIV